MKNNKNKYSYHLMAILLGFIVIFALGFAGDDLKGIKKSSSKIYKSANASEEGGKHGDSYRLYINNINLPMDRSGVIADVNIEHPDPQVSGTLGKFAGHGFLFSSGFFLSGTSNGNLWANAVASASLVGDYIPGTVAASRDPNAVMYVIKASDEPFGVAWQDWKDAVELGADFYDGDGDGIYNPVDLNGNGQWDPDEDAPDMLGDETVWCVYHDGVPAAERRWNQVDPLGIEMRQTVFAFASSGAIGNIIFLRYRMKYVGLGGANEPDELDDVYFGVWADPDLGEANDDLVGSDVERNALYTYNDQDDPEYGDQPPAYFIDFFSGPLEYIPGETFVDNNGNGVYDEGVDEPLDTAYSIRGQLKGIEEFPGARNQPLSSAVEYLNGFSADFQDPQNHNEARNYMLGLIRTGQAVDPCTLPIGEVRGGVDCSTIDPRFWFSGDPVANNQTGVGWIGTQPWDVRQMSNTGPFTLKKGEEKEIVVAYVVGQGTNAIDAISVARRIDDGAQVIFDNNFLAPSPPPAPVVEIATNEEFIDLLWETPRQIKYTNQTETYDLKFGGYHVYAFRTNSNVPVVANQPNVTLLTSFQNDNFILNLFKENGQTGGIELLYPLVDAQNRLDSTIYADESTGRIRVRITTDPFTNGPLIKGKPYYFAVTSYAVNHDALVKIGPGNFGESSDYYLSAQSFVQEVENVLTINQVVFGEDLYSPPVAIQSGNKVSGASTGMLQYDIIQKDELTGHNYSVTFVIDSANTAPADQPSYGTAWTLTNTTTGTVLVENSKEYIFGSPAINKIATEGFIAKVSPVVPDLADAIESETSTNWANAQYYYLGRDMGLDSKRLPGGGNALTTLSNNYTRADKLRRVELRFDQPGKAYRYLNGFVGAAAPLRRQSYVYAEGVVAGHPNIPDPSILDEIGQPGVGFVDVPFTAWVEDDAYGEMRQLAVGFIERRTTEGGNPDGVWDPGTSVNNTGEFIFIFDSPYNSDGNQQVYKGNFQASSVVWADIRGYEIPADANASELERRIASASFFDVLYAVGINKVEEGLTYSASDKFIINVETYPYTDADRFEFQTRAGGLLTAEEEKSLFEKVNVFPNPLFGYNVATSYSNSPSDEPFVTFTNLPNEEITIRIYSLSGSLLRTLNKDAGSTSPFLNWNLQNEAGLRVASGLYLAIVQSPSYG
ncbi:MAG: hypothetical protein R6W68_00345, partial [Ignavibacteriaceae bacterium]